MLRYVTLRFALSVALVAAILPAAAFGQSQDSQESQSVAEAARKARAQKKSPEKPPKVITDETLDVKKGDVQSATAEQPRMPGTPEAPAQPAGTANGPAQGPNNASEADKAHDALKERVALKEKIKAAQSDLDLLQREYQLDQDSFYSNPDYAKNTAGKDKLDAMKQQISDKQQELNQLKAKLAALPAAQESTETTPKS